MMSTGLGSAFSGQLYMIYLFGRSWFLMNIDALVYMTYFHFSTYQYCRKCPPIIVMQLSVVVVSLTIYNLFCFCLFVFFCSINLPIMRDFFFFFAEMSHVKATDTHTHTHAQMDKLISYSFLHPWVFSERINPWKQLNHITLCKYPSKSPPSLPLCQLPSQWLRWHRNAHWGKLTFALTVCKWQVMPALEMKQRSMQERMRKYLSTE